MRNGTFHDLFAICLATGVLSRWSKKAKQKENKRTDDVLKLRSTEITHPSLIFTKVHFDNFPHAKKYIICS